MDENEAAIRERLTAVESSVKSAHHRMRQHRRADPIGENLCCGNKISQRRYFRC